MNQLYILVSLFLLLTSCSSLGEKFKPVSNDNRSMAIIYIYRVPKFAGSAGSPYVCIDEKVVGEVVDGGYFTVQLNPGTHHVKLKSMGGYTGGINFNVNAGKTYYLRSDFSALKKGVGAGLVGDAIWGISTEERNNILANLDSSVQKSSDDAALLFVKKSFAENEITKNKKFNIPNYEKNYCEPSKKRKVR